MGYNTTYAFHVVSKLFFSSVLYDSIFTDPFLVFSSLQCAVCQRSLLARLSKFSSLFFSLLTKSTLFTFFFYKLFCYFLFASGAEDSQLDKQSNIYLYTGLSLILL